MQLVFLRIITAAAGGDGWAGQGDDVALSDVCRAVFYGLSLSRIIDSELHRLRMHEFSDYFIFNKYYQRCDLWILPKYKSIE